VVSDGRILRGETVGKAKKKYEDERPMKTKNKEDGSLTVPLRIGQGNIQEFWNNGVERSVGHGGMESWTQTYQKCINE